MAAAETTHARHSIRAGGLLTALVAAKAAAIAGRRVVPAVRDLPGLFWQDVLVASIFWFIDRLAGRPRWMWIPYALMSLYILINVGVTLTLGSPLTLTMWRAAGTTIGDSIGAAVTPTVLIAMTAVAAAGIFGPAISGTFPRPARRAALVLAVLTVLAGLTVPSPLDRGGFGRNAFTAVTATLGARLEPTASAGDFRISPFGEGEAHGLPELSGAAAGMNVLLVGLESTAARYLSTYGAPDDPTPSLTALAQESLVFDAAYAAYPESVKGLFAALCGASPAIDVRAEDLARSPCDSIVRRLSAAGYRTGLFHAGRFTYLGMQPVLDIHRFGAAVDAGAISGVAESSFGVDEPAVVTRILSWIDEGPADRPFFATYLPAAGHHPYLSSGGPFRDDTTIGAYRNAIHEGDRSLGVLLDGLRARGLYERTLIVVFGDHGEAFGQHPGNFAHSLYIYDENVRVPLIIRVPSPSPAGRRVPVLASVIDLGPTIADLVGLAGEPLLEGRSLVGGADRMALFHADYATAWLGLRDRCWKYLYEIDARRSELFDVCVDPDETRDLAAAHVSRVEAYRAHVLAWAAARREAVLSKPQGSTR